MAIIGITTAYQIISQVVLRSLPHLTIWWPFTNNMEKGSDVILEGRERFHHKSLSDWLRHLQIIILEIRKYIVFEILTSMKRVMLCYLF